MQAKANGLKVLEGPDLTANVIRHHFFFRISNETILPKYHFDRLFSFFHSFYKSYGPSYMSSRSLSTNGRKPVLRGKKETSDLL